jgi:spatacsin
MALLDYLKRNHPNDKETYTMVTLNFTMHREIAAMLESTAYSQLKKLEAKKIENSSEIITDLQSICQYFGDAAQSYMKEDCIKQSESCIRKARLIALQMKFLQSNIQIINLNHNDLEQFVSNHTKFWEALIVNDSYEKKADWSQAIFNQVVLNGNENYLNDFTRFIQLTPTIIEEVAKRYKTAKKLHPKATNNMKKLLVKHCKDISLYYRLSSYLEFKDIIDNDIKTKPYASIINDFILNKRL